MRYAAVLVKIAGSHRCLPLDSDVSLQITASNGDIKIIIIILQGDLNIVASFDRRGKHIYTGNAKGKILVLDVETFEVVASFRIIVGTSSATAVKSIEFARRGEYVD